MRRGRGGGRVPSRGSGVGGGSGGGSGGGTAVPLLAAMASQRVVVLTSDGRCVKGILRGFDQVQNLVLEHTVEVVYPPASAEGGNVEEMTHGLMVLRGDNVAVVGLARETEEKSDAPRGGVAMPPITH
eukprot:TRINITY_DN1256_c0_g1_i13.p2 TRINITY_DN1256_c0_g1~~TRINITY_DN1256_c0_g1_i13.p2  ORF type:complete len:128 (-),score=38.35 TRINITY_DN1256_c0_g1_i13:323-706(-)